MFKEDLVTSSSEDITCLPRIQATGLIILLCNCKMLWSFGIITTRRLIDMTLQPRVLGLHSFQNVYSVSIYVKNKDESGTTEVINDRQMQHDIIR